MNEGFASNVVRATGYNPYCDDKAAEAQRIRDIGNSVHLHALDQGLVVVIGPSGTGKTLILDCIRDAAYIYPRDLGFGQVWPPTRFDKLPTSGILIIDDAQLMGGENLGELLRTLLVKPRSTVLAMDKLKQPLRQWIMESRERRKLPTLIIDLIDPRTLKT